MRYGGKNIIVSPALRDDVLVLELSNDIPVSPQFRKSFDEWSEKLFGRRSEAFTYGNSIFVTKRGYNELLRQLGKNVDHHPFL